MPDASPAPDPLIPPRLVLYDGVCGLCNLYVNWLLDHDPEHVLQFAPLQGATAAWLRAKNPVIPEAIDTLVFVEDGKPALRSDAVLGVARQLHAPWRWVSGLWWVPRPVRDLAYRVVASQRYRIFGKHDSCRIPAPGQIERFME
jgi:predicted DCC family thiol-disulfide oxidoreductase YuxK